MSIMAIFKNRSLYMDWDWDSDGSIYWRTRNGVELVSNDMFNGIFINYDKDIANMIIKRNLSFLYTIGYALYFTFEDKRFYYLLPCTDIACKEYYVRHLIYSLRKLKCSKFYFREGRLD